jgi:hypothetical protein
MSVNEYLPHAKLGMVGTRDGYGVADRSCGHRRTSQKLGRYEWVVVLSSYTAMYPLHFHPVRYSSHPSRTKKASVLGDTRNYERSPCLALHPSRFCF